MIAMLLGAVAGVALQLQQSALWSPRAYQALLAGGAACAWLALRRRPAAGTGWRCWLAALAAAASWPA